MLASVNPEITESWSGVQAPWAALAAAYDDPGLPAEKDIDTLSLRRSGAAAAAEGLLQALPRGGREVPGLLRRASVAAWAAEAEARSEPMRFCLHIGGSRGRKRPSESAL